MTLEMKMSAIDIYKDLPYLTLERCGFPSNYYMMNIDQRDLMDTITTTIAEKFLDEIKALHDELEAINWDLEDYKSRLEDLEVKIKESISHK